MLSRETLEGLYITGKFITSVYMHVSIIHLFAVKSFIELTKYLLSTAGDNVMFLSERVSQDPLENYFGQLRARGGGRNENPTVQQCVHHANAIRVQKSQALNPVRGNTGRKRALHDDEQPQIDDTPLPKRKRNKK